jgi:RNase P/RNase MRP subunit p30
MKYYDCSLVNIPDWYGFSRVIKPQIIIAKNKNDLIKKSKVKGFLVLKHPSKDVFRKAVDKSLVDAILPDRLSSHDYMHHRRTLLSNVTAKIMSKNKISLLFTMKELINTKGEERALVWGRMKQELWICIKKRVPVIICSGAEKASELVSVHSLLAMGELLGLNPKKAKESLSFVQEKIIARNG